MKHLWPISLLLLAGCGVSGITPKSTPIPTATPQAPAVSPATDVLLVGDSIVNAWCSNPIPSTWACQGSPAGVTEETTTEVLARFPRAISASPRTIVIEAGTWDMYFDSLDLSENVCDTVLMSCDNTQEMVTEATNAGIKVIVCSIPPYGIGPAAVDEEIPEQFNHIADIEGYNQTILAFTGITPIDMYSLLVQNSGQVFNSYNPEYSTDGVNPNTLGGQVMTQALQAALAANQASFRLR
jgi:hypothetical protein